MTSSQDRLGKRFIFAGNHRCLDFINTEIIERGHPVDLLRDFRDLVSWLTQAQVVDPKEARGALRRWNGYAKGKRVFAQARALRGALRAMVERIVRGRPIPQSTIDEINTLLRSRPGYAQLARVSGGFERRVYGASDKAIHLLGPIAESASELLCDRDFSLIRKCSNPACVLYFYDTTKNHARRWCSMNVCGNRMKVAAHYRRRRMNEQ